MASDPFVMEYNYRPYGRMMVAAMITNVGGKVAVCGFWSKFDREQSYVKSTNLLSKSRANSKVTLGGRTIAKNLLYMNQVYKEDFVSGERANCEVTSLPRKSGYSNDDIAIRTPRLRTSE